MTQLTRREYHLLKATSAWLNSVSHTYQEIWSDIDGLFARHLKLANSHKCTSIKIIRWFGPAILVNIHSAMATVEDMCALDDEIGEGGPSEEQADYMDKSLRLLLLEWNALLMAMTGLNGAYLHLNANISGIKVPPASVCSGSESESESDRPAIVPILKANEQMYPEGDEAEGEGAGATGPIIVQ